MSQSTPDIVTGSTLNGGVGMQAVEDALKACVSLHAGSSAPSYAVEGTFWLDTSGTQPVMKIYVDSTWQVLFTFDSNHVPSAVQVGAEALTDGDTTPSVGSAKPVYYTANTAATTITGFDDITVGQRFVLWCHDDYTTLDGSLTDSGVTTKLANGDMVEFVCTLSGVTQVAGTEGMSVPKMLPSLTAGDTTPSVAGLSAAKTNNSSATTITALDDGEAGQVFTLVAADANTTIDGGLTKTGMTIPLQSGDVLQWVYDGSSWQQIAGTVGMGRFVKVDPVDSIGDWIAVTTTTFTDVDVSDDGVRKGAVAAAIWVDRYKASSSVASVQVRRNGDSGSGFSIGGLTGTTAETINTAEVPLDDNAVFEAKFSSSTSADINEAKVLGYWI